MLLLLWLSRSLPISGMQMTEDAASLSVQQLTWSFKRVSWRCAVMQLGLSKLMETCRNDVITCNDM